MILHCDPKPGDDDWCGDGDDEDSSVDVTVLG